MIMATRAICDVELSFVDFQLGVCLPRRNWISPLKGRVVSPGKCKITLQVR